VEPATLRRDRDVPNLSAGTVGHRLRAAACLASEVAGGLSAANRILRGSRAALASPAPSELRRAINPEPPVMLVHGLAANSSCFTKMERRLHNAGYTVYAVNYPSFGADLAACGRHLEREAAWLRDETGSGSVNVVAHSLGGVVLRWAVTHTWMRDWVALAITLGSPHRGTPTARLAPPALPGFGRIISQLRPAINDHDISEGLVGPDIRWVAVAAEHDWVVPAKYARLPGSENVRNVTVPRAGHLTLPNSNHCMDIILEELAASARPKNACGAA
jgi:pimeloyl-ACP methyl ester carboxylesterase